MPNPFDSVEDLTKEQMQAVDLVRACAKEFYEVLLLQPRTRRTSIAITKLEECAMWAIKAITHKE